jgi:hypothetical protein
MLLASCGDMLKTKSLALDESFVFRGVQKLSPTADGTWLLKWDAVPSQGVTYQIYAAPENEKIDYSAPLKTTSESAWESDDLRFQGSTCFVVRFTRNNKQDENAASL